MIYLKEANFEDIEKEWQYIAAMPEDENGLTNQWPDISREDFEKTALREGSIYIENATKILSVFCLTHLLYITSVMESVKCIVEKVMAQKVWH